MKTKTSTRVSIIFSIFTFFIIFILLIILNIFLFLSWYNKKIDEIKESNVVTNILNNSYKEIIWEEIDENNENDFLKSMLDFDLFEEKEHNIKWYNDLFLDLYYKNDKIYLIPRKDNNNFYPPYNVTDYFNEQLKIIKIWFLLLIIFTFLSYFISKKIFIKIALKDIFYISDKIKKIDLNNIKKIKVDLEKNDEINIIVDSINNFLEIIEKNHDSLVQFNSQVAHEFKTPLMVISSELEFLDLSDSKSESMKRIEFQIKKLDDLLSHFLLLTKIENWKNIKKEEINLYKIFNKNIKILEQKYKEKNITINLDINKKETIFTNKNFFEIIVKNLLDNAFKYNKNWWEIKISFKNNLLKIKDSWIGIENIEKVWDNLYRENTSEKGYWVWLNLVKKVVQVLWFEISLKSELWKWSEFIIKI